MNNFGITWPYILRRGHSDNPSEGACALDAINWLAHGRHGDWPECVCPVIGAYVITLNDAMPDDHRQRLLAFLPRIAGSRSPEHEAARVRVRVLAAGAAARAAAKAVGWDNALAVLDALLSAGPQGEPWSADVVAAGVAAYARADGLCVPVA